MNDEKDEEKTEDAKYLIVVGVLIISAIVVGVTALISFSVKSPAGTTWISRISPFPLIFVFAGYALFWFGLFSVTNKALEYKDTLEMAALFSPVLIGIYVVAGMFQVFIPNSAFKIALAFAALIASIVTINLFFLEDLFERALNHEDSEVIFSTWHIVALVEPLVAVACIYLSPFV